MTCLRKTLFFVSLALALTAATPLSAKKAVCKGKSPKSRSLVFAYFKDNGQDGLHLAVSDDGLSWEALNDDKPFLVPEVGEDKLMRDPSVFFGPDGRFHMVWSTGWRDRIIGYACSKDLVHWSRQRSIPVMEDEPTAVNSWSPELFYDAATKTYYIIWSTTIPNRHSYVPTSPKERKYNHRIYFTKTQDFENFTPAAMFFNPPFSVIDAAIMKMPASDFLMMVVKNENSAPAEKNLRITFSRNIEEGFPVEVSEPITGDYWCEGPSPIVINGDIYVYFDMYRLHRYGVVRSRDNGKTWEDLSDKATFPKGMRHGTVFYAPKFVVDKLKRLK